MYSEKVANSGNKAYNSCWETSVPMCPEEGSPLFTGTAHLGSHTAWEPKDKVLVEKDVRVSLLKGNQKGHRSHFEVQP